jgi:hypothetical protein
MAAAGFCAWPYFMAETPAETKPAATPELRAAVLRPDLGRPPLRDPFLDTEALRAEARASVAGAIKSLGSLSLRPRRRAAAKKGAVTDAVAARGKGTAIGSAEAPPPEAVNPLAGLVLNATYIYDKGGAAVINGRVYLPGDEVKTEAGGKPVRLSEVHFHRVVLQADGAPLELDYGVGPAKPERGARAAASVDAPPRAVSKLPAPAARSTPRRRGR